MEHIQPEYNEGPAAWSELAALRAMGEALFARYRTYPPLVVEPDPAGARWYELPGEVVEELLFERPLAPTKPIADDSQLILTPGWYSGDGPGEQYTPALSLVLAYRTKLDRRVPVQIYETLRVGGQSATEPIAS